MDNEQSPYITEEDDYKFGTAALVFIIIIIIIIIMIIIVVYFRSSEIPTSSEY